MSEALENAPEEETQPIVVKPDHAGAIMPILLFSYAGAAARIGLGYLGSARAPLSTALWPNLVGCFIMGALVEQKLRIQSYSAQIYIGLTTGFCGSLTTFSGLMYNLCLALYGPSSLSTYPAQNYLSVTIALVSAFYVGFVLGRHFGAVIRQPISPSTARARLSRINVPRWFFPFVGLPVLSALVLLAALLPVGRNSYMIYSIVLAPLGSLTRYTLSVVFNTNPRFPAGTLFANLIGSFLYFGMVAINSYAHTLSPIAKQIVTSVMQGYCGCLTTISTFILEMDSITDRRYSLAYFLSSVVPVQAVAIVLGNVFELLCSPST